MARHGGRPAQACGGRRPADERDRVSASEAPAHGGGPAMSVLELQSVGKVFGRGRSEVQALDEVTLTVDAGEMVAVMGASGSGKSTLLTIAGSLEDPTSGRVLVAGSDLATMSRNAKARLRRRRIGYVFQDYNLLAG